MLAVPARVALRQQRPTKGACIVHNGLPEGGVVFGEDLAEGWDDGFFGFVDTGFHILMVGGVGLGVRIAIGFTFAQGFGDTDGFVGIDVSGVWIAGGHGVVEGVVEGRR